jgi:hypothetical protein
MFREYLNENGFIKLEVKWLSRELSWL